jgi:hypothetical protein
MQKSWSISAVAFQGAQGHTEAMSRQRHPPGLLWRRADTDGQLRCTLHIMDFDTQFGMGEALIVMTEGLILNASLSAEKHYWRTRQIVSLFVCIWHAPLVSSLPALNLLVDPGY